MSTFKSWSKLFVLVLIVFVFAGCGGGGGSSTSGTTSDMSGWDTDTNHNNSTPAPTTPEPTTPEPVTPEPSNPEPVQPEPTPAPNTGDTYTDTYDIASVLNGEWYGVSGSGRATDANGSYSLMMYSITATIAETKITGDSGISYITYRENWDYNNANSDYTTRVTLFGDNEEVAMRHVGSNTWECIFSDGTTVTIRFTSNSRAMITQAGTTTINGYTYQYSVNGTIQKRSSVDTDTTPISQPDTQEPETNSYTDTYDIANVMNGDWYGISGSGHATGEDGTYSLIMESVSINIVDSQVTGNTLTAYMTHRQYWRCYNPNGQFVTRVVLYGDNTNMNMRHIGTNTWEAQADNGLLLIIQFTSETTAMVTEENMADIAGLTYRYSIKGTIQKRP